MGNPQKVDPTLIASGSTGATGDNPLDKNLRPAGYNPADYEQAVAPGESHVSTTPVPVVPVVDAPAVLTPGEKVAADNTRPPVDVFGGPVQGLPGQAKEPGQPVAATPQPSSLDQWNAALTENNLFSRWASDLQPDGLPTYPSVAGYDPWKDIENTPYFQHASDFIRSDSPAETQAIKNRIDERNAHEAITMRAGRAGRAEAMASGLFDPISVAAMAIPIAPEVIFASRAARIAMGVGIQSTFQTAQELALHPDESAGDMALNVGAGAILTGILGGIATRVPSAQFEAGRKALENEMHGIVPPPESSTAGAMHAGTTMAQETLAPGANFIADTVGKISPITRVMQSSSLEGRQLGQQLVDTAGYLNKNFEGIATPMSAEANIKTMLNKRNFATISALDHSYKEYRMRLGDQPAMSLVDFGEEVTNSMSAGGKHDIPEVAALARDTSKSFFDADRAILEAQGLLPEGTEVVGAEGYVPRVYDQPAIAADAAGLEQVLTDHFTAHPLGEKELVAARQARQTAEAAHTEAQAAHNNGNVDFYHGSHTPVKEFDAAHMGTGEGNQSFGIGHYVGEAPGTGLHYVPENGGYLMHGQTTQHVVNDMLDMEKSLKKQPKALEKLGVDPEAPVKLNGINPEWSGQELHDALAQGKTNVGVVGKQAAADYLKSKGFSGIKYLDQVSRKAGKGSRNFVFFNSEDAKILSHEKIGPAGERIGSGLPEKLAQHAEEAVAERAASKARVVAARETQTAARVAERKAQKLTEMNREAAEIKQQVIATMDRIQGTARGTADIGSARTPNSLKARALDVPDELLKPYLVRNYEDVMHGYHRSIVPTMEMQSRFGSTTLENELKAVDDSYAIKRAAASTSAEKESIRQEQSKVRKDLEGLRDRVLGVSNDSAGGSQKFVRAMALARAYNYLRLLGTQTLSSLSDYGRLIAHYGLLKTGAATAKFLTNVAANGIVRRDAKDMGHALEWIMDTRAKTLGEIGDSIAGTRTEKLAKAATHAYTRLTLMATWNAAMKDLGSMLEQQAVHRAIYGGELSPLERAKLASHGFGDAELQRIKGQWDKYGSNEQGLNRARTQMWDDKGAAQLLETGIGKAVDILAAHNIGKGDLPLLMDKATWRTLLQFKSFGMSSVNRRMIPLAQGLAHGDLAAANGFAMMLTLGALTYYLKAELAGRTPDMSPTRVTMEAMNWSGVLGFMPDVYDPIGGMLHLPRFSKFQDRSISESAAGPTAGTIDTLMRSVSSIVPPNPMSPGNESKHPGLTAQQVHQWRMLFPAQNYFMMSRLFNAVEGEAANSLGAKGATNKSFGERVMETKPVLPGN